MKILPGWDLGFEEKIQNVQNSFVFHNSNIFLLGGTLYNILH